MVQVRCTIRIESTTGQFYGISCALCKVQAVHVLTVLIVTNPVVCRLVNELLDNLAVLVKE